MKTFYFRGGFPLKIHLPAVLTNHCHFHVQIQFSSRDFLLAPPLMQRQTLSAAVLDVHSGTQSPLQAWTTLLYKIFSKHTWNPFNLTLLWNKVHDVFPCLSEKHPRQESPCEPPTTHVTELCFQKVAVLISLLIKEGMLKDIFYCWHDCTISRIG